MNDIEDEVLDIKVPTVAKPVMSDAVESDVLDALSQYANRDKWRAWGMHLIREQGSAILLVGPSGTGKTTIAKWMARKIKKGFKQLDVTAFAGGNPGDSERGIKAFFADARSRKNATIFMDECDHLLGDRSKISPDGRTWQLGSTETLMMEMNIYPGLVICATNHVEALDPAMANRFLSIVEVAEPDLKMRIRLWNLKIPKQLPLSLAEGDIKKLAALPLNGRQIETVLVSAISNAIRRNIKPTFSLLYTHAIKEQEKKIESK